MELNDLKNIWKKEKEELEARILLDERLIRELSFDKSKGVFDKLIKTALLGRNLALVYMITSFFVAFMVHEDLMLSILAIVGGLAMLLSFFQHLSLERPDFSKMNTLELQKSICKFRIHTSKYAKYDTSIVALWLITLLPSFLKYLLKIHLSYVQLFFILLIIVVVLILFSKDIYRKWDTQLKENEEQLHKIIEFERK